MESRSGDHFRSPIMSRISKDLSNGPYTPIVRAQDNADTAVLRHASPPDRIPHVCVVGAGMTGLRCAEVLVKNGIKVTILEGRDRIGGRVSLRGAPNRN